MMRPSPSNRMRSQVRAASERSCETTRAAPAFLRQRLRTSCRTSTRWRRSRKAVGSSRSSTSGSWTRARASSTSWRSPPGEGRDVAIGEGGDARAGRGRRGPAPTSASLSSPRSELVGGASHQNQLAHAEGERHVQILRAPARAGARSPDGRGESRASFAEPNRDRARARGQHGRGDAQQGRLADAVAADEPEHLARLQYEVEPGEEGAAADRDRHVLEGQTRDQLRVRRTHPIGPRACARRSR